MKRLLLRRLGLLGLLVLGPLVLGLPLQARAQPPKPVRIGVLLLPSAPTPGQTNANLEGLREGLRSLGYVEGQNLILDVRWAGGQAQRLGEHAAQLVRLEVAAIVTGGSPATLAAMNATSSIPIVMAAVGDPVGSRMVASLARPGGNVTGLSLQDTELDGKRIELLKEAVPGVSRIALLWSPNDPGMTLAFERVEVASRTLRLALQSLPVRTTQEISQMQQAAELAKAQALLVTAQPFTIEHQEQILGVAQGLRLPAIYTDRRLVDAGGLMAYGPKLDDLYRRAATYVDRIVKGVKPSDLPVEQPTRFELVINLRAAKALGLSISAALRVRADELME